MKKQPRLLTAGLMALGLAAAPASALAKGDSTGSYLTLDAGVNFLQDLTFNPGGAKVQMDPGFRVDLIGGYNLNDWCGFELETGFLYNAVKDDPDSAWLGQVPVLVNVVFRYENESRWTPFAGVGVGGALTIASDDTGSDTDFVFVWQGMAGVSYAINDHLMVDLSYKYLGTTEQSYDIGGSFKLDDVRNHMVGLSLTWKF